MVNLVKKLQTNLRVMEHLRMLGDFEENSEEESFKPLADVDGNEIQFFDKFYQVYKRYDSKEGFKLREALTQYICDLDRTIEAMELSYRNL